MLPSKFKDYAEAFADLNALRVELTSLVGSLTAKAQESKYADEKKNDDLYANLETSSITDLIGSDQDNFTTVIDHETEALKRAAAAEEALSSQPDVDFYNLDVTDPEMAEDSYLNLLFASKTILRSALREFYGCNIDFVVDNFDMIVRACSHFGVAQGGNAAGMLLQEHMFVTTLQAEMISICLIENNANVNWLPVMPVLDESGEPAPNNEFHSSTLSRAIRFNQDEKFIRILLDHDAKDDSNHNGLFYFLSVNNLSLAAKLLTQDINNLDKIRAKFVASEEAPAIYNSQIHLRFIKALETVEETAFTTDDKKFLLSQLNNEIAEAKSIDDCLKIYNDNVLSPCINYQRSIVTNPFSTEGFTTTRQDFMKAVQQKLFEMLRILWLTNDASTLNEVNKLRAHDIFTPLHCSYTDKQNYRAAMMDMLAGKQCIVFMTDTGTSQMVLTDEMYAKHFLHPENNPYSFVPDPAEPAGVMANIAGYFSFFSSTPADAPFVPAQPVVADLGTELKDMSATDRSDYEAKDNGDKDQSTNDNRFNF